MMALAKQDSEAAGNLLLSMRSHADAHRDATLSPVMADVGIPLADAVYAYSTGDYARVVDLLMPIRYKIIRVGGSHAQRDVFAQMLIEAALRSGRAPIARALLVERRQQKPFSPAAWNNYARALEQLGDQAGADAARTKSVELLSA